ncbi:MAG: Holliday junction resolvase RuvX [Candidatus Taylorbacteria bacterium]|nr:Holliday junction resolvase RuvX [Candidatus Taylorbacteria bacterium]
MTNEEEKTDVLPGQDPRDRAGVCVGLDYGTKRIGVSVSDKEWKMAFPLEVVKNGPSKMERESALNNIRSICDSHDSNVIVMGESKDFKNKDNAIMEEVRGFKEYLEEEFGFEVVFEPEMLSTLQASRIQGEHDRIDASAAAIILQSYLDRIQFKNNI